MTQEETEKRLKEVAKNLSLVPASKTIFDLVKRFTDESVATDIVETNTDELYKFSQYWKDTTYKNNSLVQKNLIPADLLIERTIPITDMIITHDNSSFRVTINLPDMDIKGAYDNRSNTEYHSIIVGAITLIDAGLVFPLSVDLREEAIAVAGEVILADMDYKQFKSISPMLEQHFASANTNVIETIICLLGMILPAWYGIQLALLHPVTRQIFANPKREKRDRKERLKPIPCDNGKPKTMKYIRRHIITEENDVDAAIDSALKKLNDSLPENDTKRVYERHTALWRVIGHYREYKSGKVTWVHPYWKGVLKDMGDIQANNRIVDIPDKI